MNIDIKKHCPFCKKPIRFLIGSHECDTRLRDENEILEKRINLLMTVFRAAQYTVQHRYGPDDPVGTRLMAIEDLKSAVNNITDEYPLMKVGERASAE